MTRAERMTAMWNCSVPVRDIAAEFGVKRPAVYKALRSTGAMPPYGAARAEPASPPQRRGSRQPRLDPALIVSRDPCFRCGARGDLGCAHSPSQRQSLPHHEGAP